MSVIYKYGFCFDRPGTPQKNHTNTVPKVDAKHPSKEPVTIGLRPFTARFTTDPGHHGIKKP